MATDIRTRGIHNDVTSCIGKTPLVRLRRITEGCDATIAPNLKI